MTVSGLAKRVVNKLDRTFIKGPYKKIDLAINKSGDKRQCYICKNKFNRFHKLEGGLKNAPEYLIRLHFAATDVENFRCIYCRSTDRERHLFMYFDKLSLWDRIKGFDVLHFAPETYLARKIEEIVPANYIKADFNPIVYADNDTVKKIDATAIPYGDATFDFVLFNHILEHIPDYKKALSELYRVLKPNGIAILQTPYSTLLTKNFADEAINTNDLRTFFYGQRDHVRVFGEKEFFQSIKDTGFTLETKKHDELFGPNDSYYYGVNKEEVLVMAVKPGKKS